MEEIEELLQKPNPLENNCLQNAIQRIMSKHVLSDMKRVVELGL